MSETKRPAQDKEGHKFTELLPEAIAMIQKTIVDLEVEIRIKENECDFYNEIIEQCHDTIKNGREIDRITAEHNIGKYTKLLEDAETACDQLERRQLYYKQQLDKKTILPVY